MGPQTSTAGLRGQASSPDPPEGASTALTLPSLRSWQRWRYGTSPGLLARPSSASSILASCKSSVSNPSANQLYISASIRRASSRLPWLCHRRLRRITARSSNDFALWRRAISMARRKDASASCPPPAGGLGRETLDVRQFAFRPPQFHFVVLFTVVACDRERFVKDTEPFLGLSPVRHCFRQRAQQSRLPEL